MLIRNFKSVADEVAKRNLANELLQVEINNASILDERISKSKDPNAPPPVPPVYKSQSEILKDTLGLTKQAIDGLLDMNFEYAQASQIVQHITDYHGGDGLGQFVSALPTIKTDILKKFNPKLITTTFFENYLDNFFEELNVSYGFTLGKDGGLDVGSISELGQILPKRSQILTLITYLQQSQDVDTIDLDTINDTNDAITQLTRLHDALPTLEEEQKLNTSTTITGKEKEKLFRAYRRIIKSAQIPAPIEIQQMSDKLAQILGRPNPAPASIKSVSNQIRMRTSGLTNAKLIPLKDLRKELVGMLGIDEAVIEEYVLPDVSEDTEVVNIAPYDEATFKNIMRYINDGFSDRNSWEKSLPTAIAVMERLGIDKISPDTGKPFSLNTIKKWYKEETDGNRSAKPTNSKIYQGLINAIRPVIKERVVDNPNPPYYTIDAHEYYEAPDDPTFGFGMKKAIKQHFKEDEKFLKKVAKKVADDISSDEEVLMELKKHSKREKPYEAKIEKAVGAGYIHKRIPIKKIVGKGIEVEEQPTYRTFGKYVMHIPHLTDKNVLNLKYPSLGSIPSIKPMTITEDFKDFIIDVMNTGRVNEKAFNQLHKHEQKHFERITKGAGLMDTFKLKRTGDDEEKEEVDRFNLLRGNYLGGNNSPDVVKELKGLVVKFINDGRIARNEGLNLLMELSI